MPDWKLCKEADGSMKFLTIFYILCFAIIFICIGIIIGIEITEDDIFKTAASFETSNCSGLDFLMTAKCLNDDLREWYNYNLSNINKQMNLSELKVNGGVCWQYANYYKENFINFGFNARTIYLNADDMGHSITLAWTKNLSDGNGTYCIADQRKVFCNGDLAKLNMTLYKELVKK